MKSHIGYIVIRHQCWPSSQAGITVFPLSVLPDRPWPSQKALKSRLSLSFRDIQRPCMVNVKVFFISRQLEYPDISLASRCVVLRICSLHYAFNSWDVDSPVLFIISVRMWSEWRSRWKDGGCPLFFLPRFWECWAVTYSVIVRKDGSDSRTSSWFPFQDVLG